ncbi:MAG: hypothetical protein Q9225_001511 [Loekoesia sp. 1 TL-2023]
MSFPTTPAFIYQAPRGGWTSELTQHPAAAWLKQYTETALDARAWEKGEPYSNWHTNDFTVTKADGTVVEGGKQAWEQAIPSMYAPFKAQQHEPGMALVFETPDGWVMLGEAKVFAQLHVPSPEPKVKDASGKEWDVVTPGAFRFQFVRDPKAAHDGLLLKGTTIFADSGPAITLMLRLGVMKPSDFGIST